MKDYDLGDILSITHDVLVSPRHIEGVYDILGFMTGDVLFTHQLPRAAVACKGPLLEQHPQLVEVVPPDWSEVDTADLHRVVFAWLDKQKARFGDTLPVTPLEAWHHVDPIQELAEITERPDRILVVEATRE